MAIQVKANPTRIVYLMRGLPSSGKSYTARKLTANGGLICETDDYFYGNAPRIVDHYHYSDDRLRAARDWSFAKFMEGVTAGITPIAVDRGNSMDLETQRYVKTAIVFGYKPILREPTSAWWLQIRDVLKTGKTADSVLVENWIQKLYQLNRKTHRTSKQTIRQRLYHWKWDLSVNEILTLSAGLGD